ncbi:MAG TPA: MarR family transcriptional regulator [Natronosporangium sp.]
MAEDLLDSSYLRPLRLLLDQLDREIAGLYEAAGITGVRTRFVGPLIQLSRRGSMSVQQLADAMAVTHSAMSQTVAAMRRAGLVEDAENTDGRTRKVRLTDRSRELMPYLVAEWRATEAAIRELDAEIPYPLRRVVEDLRAAFAARPFRERLIAHLAGPFPQVADRSH